MDSELSLVLEGSNYTVIDNGSEKELDVSIGAVFRRGVELLKAKV